MWRWHELLPVIHKENQVFLGEGDTPLLSLPRLQTELGLTNLYVKDESSNPTGSFKARGLAAAISKAQELGVDKVIIPTAGNAGGAMAAYAARAGLRAHIFMPKDTPFANVEESRMTGAEVILIDGLISDAAGMALDVDGTPESEKLAARTVTPSLASSGLESSGANAPSPTT